MSKVLHRHFTKRTAKRPETRKVLSSLVIRELQTQTTTQCPIFPIWWLKANRQREAWGGCDRTHAGWCAYGRTVLEHCVYYSSAHAGTVHRPVTAEALADACLESHAGTSQHTTSDSQKSKPTQRSAAVPWTHGQLLIHTMCIKLPSLILDGSSWTLSRTCGMSAPCSSSKTGKTERWCLPSGQWSALGLGTGKGYEGLPGAGNTACGLFSKKKFSWLEEQFYQKHI